MREALDAFCGLAPSEGLGEDTPFPPQREYIIILGRGKKESDDV